MTESPIPAGHTGFQVKAHERGVPITGPLGLATSADGQIIGHLSIIWPKGLARVRAEKALRDLYATAMAELDKAEQVKP